MNDIQRAIRLVTLDTGKVLFAKGDPGDAAYVLEKGQVTVSTSSGDGGEVTVATLGTGEVIGELALIDGAPRNATIRALEATQLLKIERGEFDFLRRNMRPAAFKLIRAIAQVVCARLRETNKLIAAAMSGGVKEPPPAAGAARRGTPGLLDKIFSWRRS
jgi:CRP-like cAMP-binding protein